MPAVPEGEQIRYYFTNDARRVLFFAQDEAERFWHNYIGTEHVLLGLLRGDPTDPATITLTNLGIDLEKARQGVEFLVGRGEWKPSGDLGMTPRVRKVFELAAREQRLESAPEITTTHVLRGLFREANGISPVVLMNSFGASPDQVIAESIRVQLEQLPERVKMKLEEQRRRNLTLKRLEAAFENPTIPQETKTFLMDFINNTLSGIENVNEGQS